MTIVRSEVRRILARRATTVAAVFATFIVVLVGGLTFKNHVDAAPDMARAEQLAAEQTASCLSWASDPSSGIAAENVATECYSDPAWFVDDTRFHITDTLVYTNSELTWAEMDAQTRQRDEISMAVTGDETGEVSPKFMAASGFTGGLVNYSFLLVMIATMLGATYVGADWRSGVVESQLVRVPNRVRLFRSKIAAIALVMSGATIVFGAMYMAAMLPSAVWRGDFANSGPRFWFEVLGVIGRAAVLAAVMSAIGASLAMLARNTVAGVMVPLVALVGGGFLVNTTGRWTPFVTLSDNMNAFIAEADVPYVFVQRFADGGESWERVVGHGPLAAGMLLAAASLGALMLSGVTFVRRDVS